MALALYNRVQETSTANTTVSFTLSGAITGYQSFAVVGNTNTTYYTATDTSGNWEVGVGTYSTTGPTLTRTTILSSSNSGSAVTFSGTVNVWVDYPAEKAVSTDTLSSPPAIGGTTPAAVTATTLIGGGGSANYGQLTGGATTKAVQFQTLGSDTNISLAVQPKGTGAIDLAVGSSGVNISNGGTVTAITRTAVGSGYTTPPTWSASAPTTAGGVQATGTTLIGFIGAFTSIASGGTGYTAGDTLTVVGGTSAFPAQFLVNTVSGGVITSFTIPNAGNYTVAPTSPVSVTGGTGSGATFAHTGLGVVVLNIGNAGSGYVEQPTVTFSSGSATAYATVGGTSIVRSLGQNLDFYTPNNTSTPSFRVLDNQSAGTGQFISVRSSSTIPLLLSSAALNISSTSTNNVSIFTNANSQEQFRVSHTASAVNYVQVTGGATGGTTLISGQGSDTSVSIALQAKGASGAINIGNTTSTTHTALRISTGTAVNSGNLILITGAVAGSAPSIAAISGTAGTDADIDLTLTPKGAGAVRFGTYTASVLTATGYITIKDSGGTSRRLLVG
jgi:hypothetical protein